MSTKTEYKLFVIVLSTSHFPVSTPLYWHCRFSAFPMAAITIFIGTRSALRRFSLVSSALLSRGIAYKLFVGGLSFVTTEKGLSEAFSGYGQVVEGIRQIKRVWVCHLCLRDEAENAITGMDGKALNGRVIFVDYAKPKSNNGGGMPMARGPSEPTAVQHPVNLFI